MILLEFIKIVLTTIWLYAKAIFNALYYLSSIPTSVYGLVQFLVEKDYYVLNDTFTKVLLFIAPLVVSHILVYLCDLFKLRRIVEKEIISVGLYVAILYLFTLWQFWVAVVVIIVAIVIYNAINNSKDYEL